MAQVLPGTRQGQPTLVLSDPAAGLRAELAPGRGALLISLQKDGREYLYFDAENFISADRPRCGMPVLFPCCGRNTDETVHLAGGSYHMPIHGFAHTSAWVVTAQGASPDAGAWAVLELRDSPVTRAIYPFDFVLQLTFRLQNGGLTVEHVCTNPGGAPLPFDFGYHPYFVMSELANASFTVPGEDHPFTLPPGPETGRSFPGAGSVRYVDLGSGSAVTVDYTANFDNLVLWSIPDKKFVCVEPWQGGPDGLNNGTCTLLPSGGKARGRIRLTPAV